MCVHVSRMLTPSHMPRQLTHNPLLLYTLHIYVDGAQAMLEPGDALALGQPPPQYGESGEPSLMLANGKRSVINQMHFDSWNCHCREHLSYTCMHIPTRCSVLHTERWQLVA